MTSPDISAEAVKRLARAMEARIIETYGGHGTVLEMPDDACNAAAATLRALLDRAERAEKERDAALKWRPLYEAERDAARAEAALAIELLNACVEAHETGKYDAACAAIERARAALAGEE